MQEFIELANSLADIAGEIARKYYRQPFDIVRKGDDSPVTIADRAIEEAMRALIEERRPMDSILGEEFGTKDGQSGYTWVLDPIDGTKSFVMGRPTFGALIALCKDDVPVLGVIDQPILKERWMGANGQTTFNGEIVKARSCKDLGDAVMASTTPDMFKGTGAVYEKFDGGRRWAWGGDCYSYALLASGHVDLVLEAALSPYDFAALVPVVEGAGGKMRDWDDQILTIQSDGRVLAVGDAALWDQAAAKLV